MPGFSDIAENAMLNAIFRAQAWANYLDNAVSSPQTDIAISLHTADPADAGNMSSNEAAYTNYARQNVARTTGGWGAPSGGAIALAANLDFPASGAAGTTITHWGAGKTGGGSADLIGAGAVSPNIAVGAANITPRLTTSTTISID